MMFSGKKVLIRADGGEGIGMGKLIPTLALAHKFKDEGAEVLFVTVQHHMWSPSVFKGMPVKILEKCFFQESLVLTHKEIQRFQPDIVILNITDPDVYLLQKTLSGFTEWILNLRKQGIKVVGIEGGATKGYRPDVIINWTIVGEWHKYEHFSGTKYFIGQQYVILRDPFVRARKKSFTAAKVPKSIFVSFGGGTEGVERVLFPRIMSALSLAGFKGLVHFVVGAAYRDPENLVPLLTKWPNAKLHYNIPAVELAKLMAKSDLAITAGGITLYELSCIGIPCVTLSIVPHQLKTAKAFFQKKATRDVGMDPSTFDIEQAVSWLLKNPKERARMARVGTTLVDGKGLERVMSITRAL